MFLLFVSSLMFLLFPLILDIPQASQLLSRPVHAMPDVMNDRELQAQLLSLKQQHQLQQQMLLQQFHEQQLRLAQEQDKQMANHIQVVSKTQEKLVCEKHFLRSVEE